MYKLHLLNDIPFPLVRRSFRRKGDSQSSPAYAHLFQTTCLRPMWKGFHSISSTQVAFIATSAD